MSQVDLNRKAIPAALESQHEDHFQDSSNLPKNLPPEEETDEFGKQLTARQSTQSSAKPKPSFQNMRNRVYHIVTTNVSVNTAGDLVPLKHSAVARSGIKSAKYAVEAVIRDFL